MSLHLLNTATSTAVLQPKSFLTLATHTGHVMREGRRLELLVSITVCKEPRWKQNSVIDVEHMHTYIHAHIFDSHFYSLSS